jgi:hypothetical protein
MELTDWHGSPVMARLEQQAVRLAEEPPALVEWYNPSTTWDWQSSPADAQPAIFSLANMPGLPPTSIAGQLSSLYVNASSVYSTAVTTGGAIPTTVAWNPHAYAAASTIVGQVVLGTFDAAEALAASSPEATQTDPMLVLASCVQDLQRSVQQIAAELAGVREAWDAGRSSVAAPNKAAQLEPTPGAWAWALVGRNSSQINVLLTALNVLLTLLAVIISLLSWLTPWRWEARNRR